MSASLSSYLDSFYACAIISVMDMSIIETILKLRDRWANRQRVVVVTRVKIIDADKPNSAFETFIENRTRSGIEINEIGFITTGKNVYRQICFDKNPAIVVNKEDHKEIEQIWTRRVILNPDAGIGFDRFDTSIKGHFRSQHPDEKIEYPYARDSTGYLHKGKIVPEVRNILGF